MSPITNFTLYSLSFFTLLGVVVHDMHVDRATMAAIALPAIVATAGAAAYISSSDHTHVERVAFARHMTPLHSSLPKLQPPKDDERRYILNKKVYVSGGDSQGYFWPSV